MDSFEASNIVFGRIRKFEPETVTKKIIGYILLQDRGQDMIRLAYGPDILIHNLINTVKIQLGLAPKPAVSLMIPPSMNPASPSDIPYTPFPPASSPLSARVPNSYWETQVGDEPLSLPNGNFVPGGYPDSLPEDFIIQNPLFVGLEDQLEPFNTKIAAFSGDCHYPEAVFGGSQRSPPSEFPVKVCHYFNKGFCKHGSNCRYFHGQTFPDSFSQFFGHGSNEVANDDQLFLPGSLEKLELEIMELLKMRRGNPVSIASLPMLYYEKYGRTLQAEGYLTESQRHGKAGYSLTKLLARMKNSIRLIDRPHGQHSVILAEDAPKYLESRGEKNDPGPIVSGSRQIYLTFPAESTFTEEDVSNYFNSFGMVQDVRIPCQQKRMFGFVTFVSADTVKMILSKGNPHFVCGARVLVKPYREKSKLAERKYTEKLELPMYYNSHYSDMDSEFTPRWDSSRMLRKQFMEDPVPALDVQTRRLSEMELARKTQANESCFSYSFDGLKASEALPAFSSAESFSYLLNVLNSSSTSDGNPKLLGTNYADQESTQGLNLPESPFASPLSSGISTVT